jgi:hypothetical protein
LHGCTSRDQCPAPSECLYFNICLLLHTLTERPGFGYWRRAKQNPRGCATESAGSNRTASASERPYTQNRERQRVG